MLQAKELLGLLPDNLREQVLAHTSQVAREHSNEKLEFLGDAVLGLVVASELFGDERVRTEGDAAKILSAVVSRATCAEIAKEIGLDQELDPRVPRTTNILAGAIEALLGALWTAGVPGAMSLISELFYPYIEKTLNGEHGRDYKTELQELVAGIDPRGSVHYTTWLEGPQHSGLFTSSVRVEIRSRKLAIFGEGSGRKKKDAEQAAAMVAILDLAGC